MFWINYKTYAQYTQELMYDWTLVWLEGRLPKPDPELMNEPHLWLKINKWIASDQNPLKVWATWNEIEEYSYIEDYVS